MQRSLYPSGVIVESDNLQFTESSKINAILSRLLATDTTGVTSGCVVSVNSVNATNVNVAAGTGYAPNGEYVTVPSAVTNLALASYTVGVLNYVVAFYTETYDDPQPHETNGNSYPTEANPSVRVRIYTQTQFNALPATDSNTTNDAQDRALLLGIVTAQGIGVPLTSTAIVNATAIGGALQVSNLTNLVTGVSVLTIDRTTPSGTGTLTFTYVSGASTLSWTAPGDTTAGTPVTILNSGSYTLTALSGHTLSVLIVFPSLPTSSTSDTLQITNLYSQVVPTFTADDILHRSYIGSGVPTKANPHGLTLADLGVTTDPTQTHQEIFHANGVVRGSSSFIFMCTPQTAPSPDTVAITAPGSGDSFYLGGVQYIGIGTTTVTFNDVTNNSLSLFDIYLTAGANTIANVAKFERVRFATSGTPLQTVVQLAGLHRGVVAGSGTITYTASGNTLAWTPPTGTIGSAIAVPTTASVIRLYDATYSTYIDLYVAALSSWSTYTANLTDTLTVFALPSNLNTSLCIAAAPYSGSSTGFVGNGFGVANSPNTIYNNRNIFGTESYNEISDNTGVFSMGSVDVGALWYLNKRVLFTDNTKGLTVDNGYQVNIDVSTNKILQLRNSSDGLPSATPTQLYGLEFEDGLLSFIVNTSTNGDYSTYKTLLTFDPVNLDMFTDLSILPNTSNNLNLGSASAIWDTLYVDNIVNASVLNLTSPSINLTGTVEITGNATTTGHVSVNSPAAAASTIGNGLYRDLRVLGKAVVIGNSGGGPLGLTAATGIANNGTYNNVTSGGITYVTITLGAAIVNGPAFIFVQSLNNSSFSSGGFAYAAEISTPYLVSGQNSFNVSFHTASNYEASANFSFVIIGDA